MSHEPPSKAPRGASGKSGAHRLELGRMVEKAENQESIEQGRAALGMDEAMTDVQGAVSAFSRHADTITSSLYLLIGRYAELSDHLKALLRRVNQGIVVGAVALAAMLYCIVRLEMMLERLQVERAEFLRESRAALEQLEQVRRALRVDPKAVLDEVKNVKQAVADQAKSPNISIVPDRHGQAKVVIKPGPASSAPPAPGSPQIEIPVRLPRTRVKTE